MPSSGSEIGHAEIGYAAQPFDLAPKPGLRACVQDVEIELAQLFQRGSRFQFIQNGESVQFPHGGVGPIAFEAQEELPRVDGYLIVRKCEIVLQPFQESRLENSTPSVKGVSSQPHEF